jgi:hypothetical protein
VLAADSPLVYFHTEELLGTSLVVDDMKMGEAWTLSAPLCEEV